MERAATTFVISTCLSFAVVGSADETHDRVDATFADIDRTDSPGAAVAVVQGTDVLYLRGYGMANLEHGVPVTPDTVFDIASISKQFGAMTAILLEQDGLIDFDDDVRAHVPELYDFGETVTIRHLIHHTSGIRDWPHLMMVAGVDFGDVISFEKIKRMLFRQRALNFPPGSEYAYSNTAYNLMAEIVARVSNASFREVASERIFAPLYMTDTFFADDHQEIVARRAASYEPDGDGGFDNSMNQLTALASSSLHTTITDFTRWMVNFHTKRVGGEAGLAQLRERGTLTDGTSIPYAFGIVHGEYRGEVTLSHGGSWRGFRTRFVRFPDHDFSVAVFANFSTSDPLARAERVADIYLADVLGARTASPDPPAEAAPFDVSAGELARFAGTYYSFELDTTYEIRASDDGLVADHFRNESVSLTPVGPNEFEGDAWWFANVVFIRDDRGVVMALEVNGDRVRNLRFSRRGD